MTKINWTQWDKSTGIKPQSFVCGFCGVKVGAHTGYFHNAVAAEIYICPNCGFPTFFYHSNQHPGPLFGKNIKNLSDDVGAIYNEIRESVKNSCFTAASLLGRKLIMHIAVNIAGASEGKSFKEYIGHLKNSNYIPPNADKLLDYMRKLGNEKNHEIKMGVQEEAVKTLKFIEALLYFAYELKDEFNGDDS